MEFNKRVFYIGGKKVVREVHPITGVPFNHSQHAEEDDIVLYATINLNLKPEYQMFMHLYEHLLFNNLEIDGVLYKNVADIFNLTSKYGIGINANTGMGGINVIVSIPNPSAFNKRMSQNKGYRPFSWVKEEDIESKVEMGAKILKAILFNRQLINMEILEKEVGIIKSEMQTIGGNDTKVLEDTSRVLTKNLGPVLGDPSDFDKVGINTVFDLVRTLDKHKADPEFIEFGMDYDMNIYGDPEFEDVSIAKYVRELTNLPKPSYIDNECPHKLSEYRAVIDYKEEIESDVFEASGNQILLVTAAMDPTEFKFSDNHMKNKMAISFSKIKLTRILSDITFGLLNYVREVRHACYYVRPIAFPIPELNKLTINKPEKDQKLHINLAFPLQTGVDIDELAKDVEKFIKEDFEITDDMLEILKRNSIVEFTTFDRRDVPWSSIRSINTLIEHYTKVTGLSEEEVIEDISNDYEQDPNRINKDELIEMFNSFKKNLKIIRIK